MRSPLFGRTKELIVYLCREPKRFSELLRATWSVLAENCTAFWLDVACWTCCIFLFGELLRVNEVRTSEGAA